MDGTRTGFLSIDLSQTLGIVWGNILAQMVSEVRSVAL